MIFNQLVGGNQTLSFTSEFRKVTFMNCSSGKFTYLKIACGLHLTWVFRLRLETGVIAFGPGLAGVEVGCPLLGLTLIALERLETSRWRRVDQSKVFVVEFVKSGLAAFRLGGCRQLSSFKSEQVGNGTACDT